MALVPSHTPFPPEHGLPVAVLGPSPSNPHKIGQDSSHNAGTGLTSVPGEPTRELEPRAVQAFLAQELGTPILDEIYAQLWMATKRSGRNIDALHRQVIKGRTIVISEDAGLHLIWNRNRLFVKPIPPCLFSFEIWAAYLSSEPTAVSQSPKCHYTAQDPIHAQAAGFLRSYAFCSIGMC